MENETLNKRQVVALLKDISDMAARGIQGLIDGDRKAFFMAVTQLENALPLVSELTEFPSDSVAK